MVVKLSAPHVKVIRASDPDKPLEIQTTNGDLVLWDRTRIKHRWPKFDEAPFLWLTFISWAGARRAGLIAPTTTSEAWEADVLDVSSNDDDADDSGAPFPEGLEGEDDR
jgi:hypothetical protein